MEKVIRIGTRSSSLSLWQARHVASLLRAHHPTHRIEIRQYRSRGDLDQSSPLPAIGGKGLFTEALEKALRNGEIDCAVHSLKDLPVENAAGLTIAAIPKRGDPHDVLVSRAGLTLAELPLGACIGTGSPRRCAQLLALRPDLQVMSIRGNVPTRIEKLLATDSPYDAIVLAAAGLQRLELTGQISEIFDPGRMLSAAGQGALALQCRQDDNLLALLAPLADISTTQATAAERAFLSALAGGCSLPVAAYAQVTEGVLQLRGRVIALDGSRQIDVAGATSSLSTPADLGARLAEEALEKGASQLLPSPPSDQG